MLTYTCCRYATNGLQIPGRGRSAGIPHRGPRTTRDVHLYGKGLSRGSGSKKDVSTGSIRSGKMVFAQLHILITPLFLPLHQQFTILHCAPLLVRDYVPSSLFAENSELFFEYALSCTEFLSGTHSNDRYLAT